MSIERQLNNIWFMRIKVKNLTIFIGENYQTLFLYFPLAKFTQRQNIYYYILATVSVMADIFMCTLKMLIGEKFNAWHAYIEKR